MARGAKGKNVRAICEKFKDIDENKKKGGHFITKSDVQNDVECPDDKNKVKKLIGDFETKKSLGEGINGPTLKNPQKSKLKSDEWRILKSPNLLKKTSSPRRNRQFSSKKKEKIVENFRCEKPDSPVRKFVGRKKFMLYGQRDIREFFCGPEK